MPLFVYDVHNSTGEEHASLGLCNKQARWDILHSHEHLSKQAREGGTGVLVAAAAPSLGRCLGLKPRLGADPKPTSPSHHHKVLDQGMESSRLHAPKLYFVTDAI